MTHEKKCAECGTPLKGRIDKKFCSDTCRNAFNNKAFRVANNTMRRINRTLAKNRKILSELNPNGKSRTTKSVLQALGFSFNYFTSIYETKKGSRYFYVYEQGYLFLNDNDLALVEKQDYVDGI